MAWPMSQDYNEAIQNPAGSFSDPELKQGEAVCNAMGLPVPCSGNFADVYAVQTPQRKWAVKCFTRQIPGLRERYIEISKYLPQVNLPFMVEFKFLDQGIRVRGQWYPVLKMHWVEGVALNTFVRQQLDKPPVLHTLCQIWVKMAIRLREANLAHCDLQHGNVLLIPGAKAGSLAVRLVDYDGMCVPALDLLKSIEVGHPNYQHPQRSREGTYGVKVDRFSHLVICTALRALTVGGRELWERYDNGDNLLFKEADFLAPHQSPLFAELLRLKDPQGRSAAARLMAAAQKPLEQTPLLEELVPNEKPPAKTAVRPAGASSAEATGAAAWDFSGEEEDGSERKSERASARRKQGGIPTWGWVAGVSAAMLAVVGIIALTVPKGDDKDKEPAVAEHQPDTPPTSPKKKSEKQPPKKPENPPAKDSDKKPAKDGKKPPDSVKPSDSGEKPVGPMQPVEVRPFAGHKGAVQAIAISPDGRLVLTGGEDRTVRLWELKTGKAVHKITGLDGPVKSVTFSPDGSHFYAVSGPKGLYQWETSTKTQLNKWSHGVYLSPYGSTSLTFDERDQKQIAVIWDLKTGKGRAFPVPEPPSTITAAFTAKDTRGVLVSSGGKTYAWELRNQEISWNQVEIFTGQCLSVACAPDAHLAVVGFADGPCRAFDLKTQKAGIVFEARGKGSVRCLAFLSDSRRLLSGGDDGVVRAWDVGTGKQTTDFTGHSGPVVAIAVTPDGRQALSGGSDGSVRQWDLTKVPVPVVTPEPPKTAPETPITLAGITGVALSNDNRRFLLSDATKSVRVWDTQKAKDERTISGMDGVSGRRLVITPDGGKMLVVPQDDILRLVDLATGLEVRQLGATIPAVNFVSVSSDGRLALTGGGKRQEKDGKSSATDCELCLWDVEQGKRLATWKGHNGIVLEARFIANGRQVVSCGEDGIRVWEVPSGKPIKFLAVPKTTHAAISPDGRLVAASLLDGLIRIWDVQKGSEVKRLAKGKGELVCFVFTHRGDRLLCGRYGHKPAAPGGQPKADPEQCIVQLWDLKTGKELRTFKGHTDRVTGIVVVAGGREAFSVSLDGTVKKWELPGGAALPDKPAPEVVAKPEVREIRRFQAKGPFHSVAMLRNGRILGAAASVSLWDKDTGQFVSGLRSSNRCDKVIVAPNGRQAAYLTSERQITIWEPGAVSLPSTLPAFNHHLRGGDFFQNSESLVTYGDEESFLLWKLEEMKPVRTFAGHKGGVSCVAISRDGAVVVSGGLKDGTVRVWNAKTAARRKNFPGHKGEVLSVALTDDGKLILSAGRDGTVRVRDFRTGAQIRRINFPSVAACAWNPERTQALVALSKGMVALCDLKKGREICRFKADEKSVSALSFSPDGQMALTGGNTDVALWELPKATPAEPVKPKP